MQPEQPNQPQPPSQPQPFQPGGSFSRNLSPINDVIAPQPVAAVAGSVPQNMPTTEQSSLATADQQAATNQPPTDNDEAASPTQSNGNQVSWVASEFIHQERGTMWFIALYFLAAIFAGVSIWLQWWFVLVLIIVIAITVSIYTRLPPHQLNYVLDENGLSVDGKPYPYESFKSFGVIKDGEHYSIMLIPVQRFQPGLTVYFPEESGEEIVDVLGAYLPMKEMKLDAVDRIVRMLRL